MTRKLFIPILLLSCLAGQCFAADNSAGQWPYFGGSKRLDRYSPLAAIDARNVGKLHVVWTRPSIERSLTDKYPDLTPDLVSYLRGTPLMIDGVLYSPDGLGLVEAFDALTGKTLWVQQPFEPTLREAAGESTRGVAYWSSGSERRIISLRGEFLYALDAATGTAIASFGDRGRVSLDRPTPDQEKFRGSNGPLVVGDIIVLGGNGGGKAGGGVGDGGPERESRPEDIRAYDVRTGKQEWQFHVMPRRNEPGYETWGKGSAEYVGNMGAWAPLSADEERGIVYVPLTAPTNSYYGGHRPGANLFADCLVALEARTGKALWYFQTVHHDMWDYDNASPPTLGDITVDGRRIEAVMQPNKSGFLFVLDRVTGKPVWPITERPVPASQVPGEAAFPTQPFPSAPPAFDRQGVSTDDLIDFTPELRAAAEKFAAQYVMGPLFTPPSLAEPSGKKGTLAMPGGWGSGNWNTGAFDPVTGIYYAVSMSLPTIYALKKPTEPGASIDYELVYDPVEYKSHLPYGPGPTNGLPLLKPPYGRITALDLNKGTKLWMVPNGEGPRNHPLLKGLNLPYLGTIGRPAPLLTRTLLFVGESSDAVLGVGVAGPTKFRAYDKANGKVLWETTLPAGTTGGPITYSTRGTQLIVVPIGGRKFGSAWVALGLADVKGALQAEAPAAVASTSGPKATGSPAAKASAAGQQPLPDGKALFDQRCASCHGTALQGGSLAPPLRGNGFKAAWNTLPARKLYSRIITTMPQDNPGTLTERESLAITLHVLSANDVVMDSAGVHRADDLNTTPMRFQ